MKEFGEEKKYSYVSLLVLVFLFKLLKKKNTKHQNQKTNQKKTKTTATNSIQWNAYMEVHFTTEVR